MVSRFKTRRARIWQWGKRIFIFLFVSSFIYLLICKWVMPPITLTQLSAWISGDGLKRDYVNGSDISPDLKLAAMAGEDQLFPLHGGFDWKSLEKSLSANLKNKNRMRGSAASTISQQVAKNVFLWQGEGVAKYIRKIPEFYFTKMIEWMWGKQRILEVYLNVIETGKGMYGVETACQDYFGKSAKHVSKMQAAMIIACLPNPKKYTVKPMSRFVNRRSGWIIKQMENLKNDENIKALVKQ